MNILKALALVNNQQSNKITSDESILDFWSSEAKLSDYGPLVDDYDVADVEDIHMQSALKYGW